MLYYSGQIGLKLKKNVFLWIIIVLLHFWYSLHWFAWTRTFKKSMWIASLQCFQCIDQFCRYVFTCIICRCMWNERKSLLYLERVNIKINVAFGKLICFLRVNTKFKITFGEFSFGKLICFFGESEYQCQGRFWSNNLNFESENKGQDRSLKIKILPNRKNWK